MHTRILFALLLSLFLFAPSIHADERKIKLSWDAPTTNEDHTAEVPSCLTDLNNYKVYYGNSATTFTDFWQVPVNDSAIECVDTQVDAGTTCGNVFRCTYYTPQNMTVGMWYFKVTANDHAGNESVDSNIMSKEIVNNAPSGCTNGLAE